ncbi:2-amino-4-hydroxy-6-hydroxymethyldihydropteridine diphosphokinase [Caulobacter henricii]|uniref:2-amino-4-hydroxy-6- hydroxymethyldihydropteridine diphosphokinase n=1 Tax=Caulobacter henricii TaxID=69395 RepID=UPI002FF864D6
MVDQNGLDEAIIVALGSNLAGPYTSREALLEAALVAFPAEGLQVTHRSGWWTSAAWPDASAPPFLNGVVLVDAAHDASAVLSALHRIEASFGRDREVANSPRTLDLDLIAYGRQVISGGLTVPHPRAHERLFVMGPLAEIAPGWRHPVSGELAVRLADAAKVGRDARP